MKRLTLSLLAALFASTAQADGACWAAPVEARTSGEDLPTRHARYAPLHQLMDTLASMVRDNPGLRALPEVRLRLGREINAALDPKRMPHPATLHALGFGPKAWGRGDCELIPQADRLGPRAGISFFVNSPTATLNRWEHDEQLTTYLARPATASFQGWPTYGECALISKERRLPWVAVTVGEMLALFERQRQRELEEWDRRNADAFAPFDLAAAEREAASLRTQNAQAADALLLGARQRKALEPQAHAALRSQRQHLLTERDGLRAALTALTPAERNAPYQVDSEVGSGKHRLPTTSDAREPTQVVKLDPSFPWDGKNRQRLQLLTVCAPQIERNPNYHPPMREAVAALDFARLAALLN